MNAKTMVPLIAALVVLTAYLVFQLWGPVASDSYNRTYSRDIIAQIHLTSIQFTVDLDTISRGYFIANLTVENPTNETLALGRVHGEYYSRNVTTGGGWKIAEGWTWVNSSGVVIPGSSVLALRMELDPWGVPLEPRFMIVPNYTFAIYYTLKLRYVSYQMTAIFRDSTIEIEGPAYPSDEIYTLVHTYVFSIVGAWILGFEIVAISLIRKEKTSGTVTMLESMKHSRMFSIIYASQGLGIIAAQGYYQLLYRLIPRPPVEFQYVGGPAAIAAAFIIIEINMVALLLLIVAAGLFFRKSLARKVAFLISLILALTSVSAALFALKPLIDQRVLITYNLAMAILFSAIAISHAIVIYVFAFKKRRIVL